MLASWVKARIKPGERQRFLKAIEVDALGSEGKEAGCLRFNVLKDEQDENVYYFYEVYKDEAALEAHRATPHYAVWKAVADTLDGPTEATRCRTVFPAGRTVLDSLVDFVWLIGSWGYAVVFLGAALESAAFLGLLVPGESLVIVSGMLAAAGLFDLPTLITVISAGAGVGGSIGYELGRRLGRPWLLRRGGRRGFHRDRIEAVDA